MKKRTLAVTCVVVLLAAGGGGYGVYRAVQSGGTPVPVVSVASFSQFGYFGDPNMLSGNVASNISQEVHLESDKIVKKVFVKEGDKVKIGDKLMKYDTTLMELDLEMYQLDGQTILLKTQGAKKDLEKLKNTVPIVKNESSGDPGSPDSPNSPGGGVLDDEDNFDDEARANLIQNVVYQSASSYSGMSEGTENGQKAETEAGSESGETGSTDTNAPDPTEKSTDQTEGNTESEPQKNSISVQVIWEHGTNADTARPASAALALMNGNEKTDEKTVSAENGWKTEFELENPDLNYMVKGQEFDNYAITSRQKGSSFTIRYTYKEPSDSPDSAVKPYSTLDYKSEAYKGKGTKDNPYVFFCKDGTLIKGSFINKMMGFNETGEKRLRAKGYYIKLEIREADSLMGGFIKSIGFDGTIRTSHGYEPGITWIFTSDGIKKQQQGIKDPTKNPDKDPGDDDGDIDWDDGGDFEDGYTEEELKAAIKEKERDIKNLELDKKENDLKVTVAARELDGATVTSTINGVVKTVGDPSAGEVDGKAFIVITSDEGLYLKGAISELQLDSLKKGDVVQGQGYESGVSFSATITDVSQYPVDGNYYGFGSGNPNSSYYPFTAYIENVKGLGTNEGAQITLAQGSVNANAIYLEKSYVRTENGQSYVYKVDENNRLKQQFVKTGKIFYQQLIEVKEGLTKEDKIAFPYGKNVKNGAKVTDENADDGAEMLGM